MTMSLFRKLVIGFFVLASMGVGVQAIGSVDELQNIRTLANAKEYQEAMKALDVYLERHPGDAQGRFLKGILFSDQKQFDDAINVFVSLTEDYPELPEPYNNLAVLYAGRGKYLKARDALLVAIKTHPSYATAHENLGDIYAMMATEAYKKALALDEENRSAKSKLDMIRELFSAPVINKTKPPTGREPITMAGVESYTDESGAGSSSIERVSLPAETPAADIKDHVLPTLQQWAGAWSDRDVEGYIAFYAPTFLPSGGRSLSSWKKLRRKRLSKPASISVEIIEPRVVMLEKNKARVRFTQKYRSDTYRDTVTKAIEMVYMDGNWRFVREEVID
uniref:Tetratricopeptide repeat-containing protein n=1 Tax=Candidatus Kentrum sp. MB TaxID=2138164 RepID=A0A450XUA9_9GAMM|nr:MAG: Tetratricopeptide repeat-containing protein [Candidatus Kentron sp. MB]VFK75933.1 MAG: Tetratricopeptide repeat-containing protein [Candidatus Kentron sp. MB]